MPRAPRPSVSLPLFFLALTVFTTLTAGYILHVDFSSSSAEEAVRMFEAALRNPLYLLFGLPFSLTLLGILLAHEMGHYLACRYYGIVATPPYVIPAPPVLLLPPPLSTWLGTSFLPFNPFGTFGAVIRIRTPFRNRKQLFDVGIAGPLAGFVLILPALAIGLALSQEFEGTGAIAFGKPLLLDLAAQWFYTGQEDLGIRLHPIGFAAWFGMLATGLNLLPIGQLDGGHIVYSLFGGRVHRIVSLGTFVGLIGISFLSWPLLGYLFFALVLYFLGFRHPSPLTDDSFLGSGRIAIALLGLLVFILTFIPIPIRLL